MRYAFIDNEYFGWHIVRFVQVLNHDFCRHWVYIFRQHLRQHRFTKTRDDCTALHPFSHCISRSYFFKPLVPVQCGPANTIGSNDLVLDVQCVRSRHFPGLDCDHPQLVQRKHPWYSLRSLAYCHIHAKDNVNLHLQFPDSSIRWQMRYLCRTHADDRIVRSSKLLLRARTSLLVFLLSPPFTHWHPDRV